MFSCILAPAVTGNRAKSTITSKSQTDLRNQEEGNLPALTSCRSLCQHTNSEAYVSVVMLEIALLVGRSDGGGST